MTGEYWKGGPGKSDYVPAPAQRDALQDLRDVTARGVLLTKEIALSIERARGLTRVEFIEVMDEYMGFHVTRGGGKR